VKNQTKEFRKSIEYIVGFGQIVARGKKFLDAGLVGKV
jgi:hypothetical protein